MTTIANRAAQLFLILWASSAWAQPVPAPQLATPIPEGFVEMQVMGVVPMEMGNVVALTDRMASIIVPIWIGNTEALAIQLRLTGEGFQRPLTHDLVETILRELGGRLVEVRIDSLEANTFVATLRIEHGDRTILLDSRASDAIALALGASAPIFVSEGVVAQAGLSEEELGLSVDDGSGEGI